MIIGRYESLDKSVVEVENSRIKDSLHNTSIIISETAKAQFIGRLFVKTNFYKFKCLTFGKDYEKFKQSMSSLEKHNLNMFKRLLSEL